MRTGVSDFTLKFFPLNIISTNTRLQRTSSLCLQPHRMADTTGTTNIPAPHPIQHKSNANADKKEIPPPPEKPESGDCCGSGCVRCVWDIYYDELEEYNKLYKQAEDLNPKS